MGDRTRRGLVRDGGVAATTALALRWRPFSASPASAARASVATGPAHRAPSDAQLRALASSVKGRVIAPGAAGYDKARELYNRRFDGIRPPAVVRVASAQDVGLVLRWATQHGIGVVPRSGGHAYNGSSTSDSAIVLDLGGLDDVRVQPSEGRAAVGPGARVLDVATALAARGVAVPLGSCPTVGLGGLITGGGYGLASRRLGLAIDRVVAMDVVTADGRRRRIAKDADADLFWAMRGGGGSFAVATAFHLQTTRVDRAAFFSISFPSASAAEALLAWDAVAPGAPRELTATIALSRQNGGMMYGQYFGGQARLDELIAPLRRVAGARTTIGTEDYLSLQRRWAGCSEQGSCQVGARSSFAGSSVYVARRLTRTAAQAFAAAVADGAMLICDAYGGAIAEVPVGATAFVHRDARFSVQILGYGQPQRATATVRRARAKLAQYGNGQAYQNYADPSLPAPLRSYYGANGARLARIKATVDPRWVLAPVQGVHPRV